MNNVDDFEMIFKIKSSRGHKWGHRVRICGRNWLADDDGLIIVIYWKGLIPDLLNTKWPIGMNMNFPTTFTSWALGEMKIEVKALMVGKN